MRNILLLGLLVFFCFSVPVFCDTDDDSMNAGSLRLETLQNNDGGWDWPLDDGNPDSGSAMNTIGPIAMGLARGYWNSGDASFQAALADAGTLLLTKTNNFSTADGFLATMLDSVFGGSTYRDHVQANFYSPLAAGIYNKNGSGTLYSTASYVQYIRDVRTGNGNLGEWDLGLALVGAASCGADTTAWIDGVKAELNEHDISTSYDVCGLAGALYGLAFVGEDFDPITGDLASASNLNDLGNILSGYQIDGGGFTWDGNTVIANDGNESVQNTGYAILALNQLGRGTYLDIIQGAADWLVGFQLGTGGWGNYAGSDENNEVTAEAMWGIHAVYVEDVWVDENGSDHAFGYGYIPFETLEEAVSMIGGTNGTIHIGDGTFTLGPGTYITRLFIEGNASVSGAGTTTLESPGTTSVSVPESSSTFDPIIFGYGGTMDSSGNVSGTGVIDADISGFEIDGLNNATSSKRFVGILLRNVDGEVSDNSLHSLYDADGEGDGPQTFGILVYGDSAVDILNNTITDYSRGGIVVSGDLGSAPDPVATVQGNTVTGNGFEAETGWWADNGIQFGYGATGQIIGNTVTGHWSNSDWTASGIIISCSPSVLISGNHVLGNETGVAIAGDMFWSTGMHAIGTIISGNDILGNEYGVSIQDSSVDSIIEYNVISGNHDGIDICNFGNADTPTGTIIRYNSISGNNPLDDAWWGGLWVADGVAPVMAALNWWGSADGPAVDMNGDGLPDYDGGGDAIYGNVIFSPWLGTDPDGDPVLPGVQIEGPVTIIVAPVGPEPAGGYLNAGIAGANDLPFADTIEVWHGTYDASATLEDAVTLVSEVGSAANTILNGPITIDAADILLGRIGQGFTINGPITVGAGRDASTIHINWNDIFDFVINNGDNTLDATFNYWGEDGPDTIGLVAINPILPESSDIIVGYMADFDLNALQAIDFSYLLDELNKEKRALVAIELMATFGFTVDEALELIDTYGWSHVRNALRWCDGDYDQFLVLLVGYAVGGHGGGGGGAAGEIDIYTAGDIVPLVLELLNPITGEVVDDALVSYSVCQTLPDGTVAIVAFGVMTYDSDLGAFTFNVDTTGYEPGIYDVYLGTDDGRSQHFQIEVTAD